MRLPHRCVAQHVASAASGGVVSLVKFLLYFLPFHVVWTELDWSDKFLFLVTPTC